MALEMTFLQHVLIWLLNLSAGGLVFLAVTNRILGQLKDRWSKPMIMLGLMIVLVGGPGLLAWVWPQIGLWSGGVMWVVLAVGEARQRLIRYSRRGEGPQERCYFNPHIPSRTAFWPVNTAVDVRMDRYNFALPGKDADSPGLPGRLKPGRLRIVHLSDWHVTQKLPASYYKMVVAQANAAQPDLIFLTGDFITHHENIARLPGLLAGLRSRYGAYAILGNHDVWAGTEDVIAALTASGVHYIGGGTHMLALPGLPRLVLAGDEMPWNRAGRQEWPKLGPGDIGLGLSHSADQVRRFSRWGAAAVFTGHYHGGQFCLPVVGPIIVPSKYGRRYARGHFVVDDTHLYVSGGVGCAAPPVRIYCPPDFLVVDMLGLP